MTRRVISLFVIVLFVAVGLSAQVRPQARVQAPRWEVLGQKNVTDRVEHDIIPVTRAKGTYTAIKIEVQRRAVDFHRVTIHFANGDDQNVEMRASIPARGETRVIDIEGNNRIIRSIEFWYDAKTLGKGQRSTVRVLGRH
jgi:hypothetical protein